MILTIATHAIAFICGAGATFLYLHKHTTAAINLSTQLAADAAKAKEVIAAGKAAA